MSVIFLIAYWALLFYFLVMWGRFIFDWVRSFSRQWRPKGVLLVVAELVYTLTDPPLRLVRRVIPPLRIGGFALDFGWTVVMIVVIVLMSIAQGMATL